MENELSSTLIYILLPYTHTETHDMQLKMCNLAIFFMFHSIIIIKLAARGCVRLNWMKDSATEKKQNRVPNEYRFKYALKQIDNR